MRKHSTSRIPISLVLGLALSCVAFSHVQAQTSDSAAEIIWFDGETKHVAYTRRDLVADFGPENPRSDNRSLQKSSIQVVKQDGSVRILKRSSSALQKTSNAALASDQSPVFADGPSSGALRTLPGGIIVTFSTEKSVEELQAWANENGVEFDRRLPVTTAIMALFKTNPGLESLESANRVRSLPDVRSAQPNWWVEKWKGADTPVFKSKSEATKAKSTRAEMSRRLAD